MQFTELYKKSLWERERLTAESPTLLRQLHIHLKIATESMFPLLAGGIFIAFAYFFDDFRLGVESFGGNYPFVKFFQDIGVNALQLMLLIFPVSLSISIAGKKGAAPGLAGGAIAVSGGAGFLGALMTGLFIGFFMNWLDAQLRKVPIKARKRYPMIEALLGMLAVSFVTMFIIIPPLQSTGGWLVDAIKDGTAEHPLLMGTLAAALMGMDFGGPISKGAYLAGVASFAGGSFVLMAAVMAGAMVPSLAICLSASIFRYRYTKDERRFAPACLIFGLAGIPEGAVPFAAGSPASIVFCSMLSSALAGFLVTAFGCTVYVPYGGVFVLSAIGGPVPFLFSVLLGSIAGCALLLKCKRP